MTAWAKNRIENCRKALNELEEQYVKGEYQTARDTAEFLRSMAGQAAHFIEVEHHVAKKK